MSTSASVNSLFSLADSVSVAFSEATETSAVTRDYLSGKIREELDDQGYFYSSDDLIDSIQDAYDEICAFTGCILKATSIPIAANKVYYDLYTLIPDFLTVVGVWNTNTKQWLRPHTYRKFDEYRPDWEKQVGSTWAFAPVNYKYIAIYPRYSTALGNFYVFYKAQAPTLSGATEFLIPPDIAEDVLTNYVTMDLLEQAEEWNKAQNRFKLYTSTLEKLIDLVNHRDLERIPRVLKCL